MGALLCYDTHKWPEISTGGGGGGGGAGMEKVCKNVSPQASIHTGGQTRLRDSSLESGTYFQAYIQGC